MLERTLELPVVDGLDFPEELRQIFRPGEPVGDGHADLRWPRWFIEVGGREAGEIELAPFFRIREFLRTDVREVRALHRYPRYLPCAVGLLAAALSTLRNHWGTYVHIAANGAYRSPAHALASGVSAHCWGTAADIYRIGDNYLDSRDAIEDAAAAVRGVLPNTYVREYGHGSGLADDHLHIDLGFAELIPWEAVEERRSANDGHVSGS